MTGRKHEHWTDGERRRLYRYLAAGMTQREAALALGVTQGAVQHVIARDRQVRAQLDAVRCEWPIADGGSERDLFAAPPPAPLGRVR